MDTFKSYRCRNEYNDGTNHSTQGKKYVLTFTLDKNDAQEESRTGKITVKSGDLMLTAQIIQKGKDFKRDVGRPVTLLDGSIPLTTDYFKWLDKVQGIKPEEMYDGDVASLGMKVCILAQLTIRTVISSRSWTVTALKTAILDLRLKIMVADTGK